MGQADRFFLFLLFLSCSLKFSQQQTLVYNTLDLSSSSPKDSLKAKSRIQALDNGVLELELVHESALAARDRRELVGEVLARDEKRVEWIKRRLSSRRSRRRSGSPPNVRTSVAAPPSMSTSVTSGLALGSGEYFVRVSLGTPPRSSFLVLDTGSDVPWLQCAPCKRCYKQADPVFDPRNSSSFAALPCASTQCRSLGIHGCGGSGKRCIYQVSYGDGSFTMGDLGTETFTLGGGGSATATATGVVFGCGYDNEGLFVGAGGLLGLGGGKLSFVSQIGSKRFSYCLPDRGNAASKSGTLAFGAGAIPSSGTAFTPLLKNPKMDTFYYATMASVSVGGVPLPWSSSGGKARNGGGGGSSDSSSVIIDSGTAVTRLPSGVYTLLRAAFRNGTAMLQSAPKFSLFDTCFNFSRMQSVDVPAVDFVFDGGAQMRMPAANYMVPVDRAGTYCLALAPASAGLAIVGNIQQQGFRIGFDTQASKISFTPHQCS